jgi:hypothetical protein
MEDSRPSRFTNEEHRWLKDVLRQGILPEDTRFDNLWKPSRKLAVARDQLMRDGFGFINLDGSLISATKLAANAVRWSSAIDSFECKVCSKRFNAHREDIFWSSFDYLIALSHAFGKHTLLQIQAASDIR